MTEDAQANGARGGSEFCLFRWPSGTANDQPIISVARPPSWQGANLSLVVKELLDRYRILLDCGLVQEVTERASKLWHDHKFEQAEKEIRQIEPLVKWSGRVSDSTSMESAAYHLKSLGVWQADVWIGSNGRLGPMPRILLLLRTLISEYGSEDGVWRAIDSSVSQQFHVESASQQVREHFRSMLWFKPHRVSVHYSNELEQRTWLMAAFNRMPLRHQLPVLRYSNLFEVDLGVIKGSLSLDDYESWLRKGRRSPVRNLSRLPKIEGTAGRYRANAPTYAKNIVRHLHKVPDMLLQLPIRDSPDIGWQLASACASAADEHGWTPIWLCASRRSEQRFPISASEFLRPLAEAFAVSLPEDPCALSGESLLRIIDALRAGLSTSRCFVVVEGLRNAGGRVGPALDFLSGVASLEEIVRGLAVPPLSSAFVTDPDAGFGLSRILVLPQQPLRGIADFSVVENLPAELRTDASAWALACKGAPDETGRALERGYRDLMKVLEPPCASGELRDRMTRFVSLMRERVPEDLILFALIASVPDGMLLPTLSRVFSRWTVLINSAVQRDRLDNSTMEDLWTRVRLGIRELQDAVSSTDSMSLNSILTRYRSMVVLELDESVEHLSARKIFWEVGQPFDEGAGLDSGFWPPREHLTLLLKMRTDVMRDLFVEAFSELRLVDGGVPAFGRDAWRSLQLAVAGECQRQATALYRNAHPSEVWRLALQRRTVQSLHHLLVAGDLEISGVGDQIQEESDSQALLFASDAYRRRLYGYVLIYRNLIEDGQWRLSRAWGRSELRVGILLQALYSGMQPLLMARQEPRSLMDLSVDSADSVSIEALLNKVVMRARRKRDNAPSRLREHELRLQREFFINLTHAAADAEDHSLAWCCLQIVKELAVPVVATPHARARSSPSRGKSEASLAPSATDQLKLEFDVADSRGEHGSVMTELCTRAISSPKVTRTLVDDVLTLGANLTHEFIQGGNPFNNLRRLNELRMSWVQVLADDAGTLKFIADMLARWADVLSNEADRFQDLEGLVDWQVEVKKYAEAWVAFWLANALRAELGMVLSLHGREWGRVSSRAYRTGIRATLRLARLVATAPMVTPEPQPNQAGRTIPAASAWLLEYARSRADTLAREVYMHEREQIQCILIHASIARTVANISRDRRSDSVPTPAGRDPLEDARDYVISAERRLVGLGCPRPLARRWIVERLAVLGVSLKQAMMAQSKSPPGGDKEPTRGPAPKVLAAAIVVDLTCFARLADGSQFWLAMYRRALRRYAALWNDFGRSDWPSPPTLEIIERGK